ncbi:hypothetical protein [Zeimonas arvi]|uniref:Uncharacterized protein n=1 Tax=Zeimonas arvi TaxID=2498847 RepID=A0A5C8P3Z8_9BURK|nr:hypothetical protein [Zeimonas arvi]TXL68189.1 hypothetical protein FHP08_00360 [Zeimonas arvi]
MDRSLPPGNRPALPVIDFQRAVRPSWCTTEWPTARPHGTNPCNLIDMHSKYGAVAGLDEMREILASRGR